MPDLRTRLSALMIEFSFTHSQKTLLEMTNLIQRMNSQGDFRIFREFFLSSQLEARVEDGARNWTSLNPSQRTE